jgi:hypothetical protein
VLAWEVAGLATRPRELLLTPLSVDLSARLFLCLIAFDLFGD